MEKLTVDDIAAMKAAVEHVAGLLKEGEEVRVVVRTRISTGEIESVTLKDK